MNESPTPLWCQDESLCDLRERLSSRPNDIRVVSFDFFDTLLYRMCAEPHDLFIEVGRRLAARQLLLREMRPEQFQAVRRAADDKARKFAVARKKSSEVTLADIYAQLNTVVEDVQSALQVEMETELDFCYSNPSTTSLAVHVRQLGLKTALISDTYFTRPQILALMRASAIAPGLFDVILLSNEKGCAKWEGGLFREAFAQFDIHANELLHIGDNMHADVIVPNQLGVDTVHYYRMLPCQEEAFMCERDLAGHSQHPAASLNSLRVLAARLSQDTKDPFREGAFVLGPVLARYADWCVTRFKAAGVTTVLALMREGELLGELVREAAQAAGVNLRIVSCFVSRISTARAAMSEVSCEQIEEQLEGHAGLTAQAIFEILDLADEAKGFMTEDILAKPLGSSETVRGLILRLTKQSELRDLIEKKRSQAQKLAFEYLNSMTGSEPLIGVIDLGWSGSIQRNISRILRNGGRSVQTLGCYVATTRRSGRLFLEGDEAHAYLDQPWDHCTILPEVAITACVGSTDGYVRGAEGQIVPVLGPFAITPEEVHQKRRIREGILAFQMLWLNLRATRRPEVFSGDTLADIDLMAGATIYRLLDFPTKQEADRLGGLKHDENFFGKKYSHVLCDADSEERFRSDGIERLFSDATCYWPQGVVARANPRLISGLARRWKAPMILGRAGACHRNPVGISSLTEEEIVMLGDLMQDFQPQQVIYVSRSASDVENLLGKLWPTGDVSPSLEAQDREVQAHQNNADGSPAAPRWPENASVEPRLVVLGEEPSTRGNDSFLPWCEHVPGDPAQVETLRAVHKLVQPCARIALVLAGDLEDSAVAAILNFLGPFLGPEGLVLASHGRFDPSRLTTEHPLTLVLNRWFERIGGRLGYDLWETPEDRNPHVYNWSVFLRKTSNRECEAHWELTPADVPTAAGKGLYEHITSIKAPAEASSQKVAEAKLASAKDSFRKP